MDTLEIVAVIASGLFAGASIYINLVEHPARLSCGTAIAVKQWAPSYKRATVMQVSLALVATVAGIGRGLGGDELLWYLAAALIFAVIPFTLIGCCRRTIDCLHQDAIQRPPRRSACWRNGVISMLSEVGSA